MSTFAVIGGWFTLFVLTNFIGTYLLQKLSEKWKEISVIKGKEVKLVSISIHFVFMTVLTCFSLWFVVVAWDHSRGDVLVDRYLIYLEIIKIGIGFYLYDIAITRPQKARLIHHFVSIVAYMGILEENKFVWYGAVMNVEAYKTPLIIMQFLYYFNKTESLTYRIVRCIRMLFWILFKCSTVLVSIIKSILNGFPSVSSEYYALLISISVTINIYSLYIMRVD